MRGPWILGLALLLAACGDAPVSPAAPSPAPPSPADEQPAEASPAPEPVSASEAQALDGTGVWCGTPFTTGRSPEGWRGPDEDGFWYRTAYRSDDDERSLFHDGAYQQFGRQVGWRFHMSREGESREAFARRLAREAGQPAPDAGK